MFLTLQLIAASRSMLRQWQICLKHKATLQRWLGSMMPSILSLATTVLGYAVTFCRWAMQQFYIKLSVIMGESSHGTLYQVLS